MSTRPLTSFAPRALMRAKGGAPVGGRLAAAVPSASAKAGKTGGEGEGAAGGGKKEEGGGPTLSNDDFRQLFLGGRKG